MVVFGKETMTSSPKEGANYSLLSSYAEAWFSGLFDEHQHNDRPWEGGPEKAVNVSRSAVVSQRVDSNRSESHTVRTNVGKYQNGTSYTRVSARHK